MVATAGILHVAQPARARSALRAQVAPQDAFALTALYELTSLSGSLVIGLAAQAGHEAPDALWQCSRVDETWQEGQWGRDAEAAEAAEAKRRDFVLAARFHALSRPAA
jgi:chaperone required for assembly of F1-ATPase